MGLDVALAIQLAGRQIFNPGQVFLTSDTGDYYDWSPTDLSSLYQDSAGTTPVTAVEQPMGRLVGKRNSIVFIQPTSTSRPVLRSRVNGLTYSNDFANAAWTKTDSTVTPGQAGPTGLNDAALITEGSIGNASLSQQAALINDNSVRTFLLRRGNTDWVRARFYDSGATNILNVYLNLATGVVGTATVGGTAVNNGVSLTAVGSGFFLLRAAVGIPGSTGVSVQIHSATGDGNPARVNNATYYISRADIRPANIGSNIPAYQEIRAANDYDTAGFPLYLDFDGVDDGMYSTATVDMTGTDKVSVFAGVRKNSDAAAGRVIEASPDPSTNNGAFGLSAPGGNGVDNFAWISRGTAAAVVAPSGFPAPLSAVLTGLGGISTDLSQLYRNSVLVGGSGTDQGTGNYGSHTIYVMRRNNTTNPFNGRIYPGFGFVGKLLNATQRAQWENYINTRMGRIY